MKKQKYLVISVLFLVVALFILGTVLVINKMEKVPGDNVTVSSNDLNTSSSPLFSEKKNTDFYKIKITPDGKIGVFYGETEEPNFVLHEIVLMALPKFDRELLSQGITVYSNEELYTLIEDLDS